MSRTEQELRQALAQAEKMPEGDARIALLEDLVRHADALADQRLMFDTRMELTGAYQHGGETGKGFVTFSWCLAAYDRDPGSFTSHDDWLLRWHYKWVVAALKQFPEVPLDRSYRALDDMERRYLAGGHSLHAVYALRCEVADHIGDLAAGDEWYRKWTAAPRDENSDCVACDPTSKVYHLAQRGADEEAVAIADPVLAGRITCTVQPQSIQAALLLPYLRTGRLEQAVDAHRKGYRGIRGNRDYLQSLGGHLEFCALTGNQARGLEILERHLGWLDRPPEPMALLETAGSAALLLRRLREDGHGGQRLRRPAYGDRPASEPEVAELEAELTGTALRLAARFDERNGTDHQTRVAQRKLAAEPVVEHLPLTRTARKRPVVTAPAVPVATDDLDGLSPERLLEAAEEHYAYDRVAQAQAALRRFDEQGSDDPLLTARRDDLAAVQTAEDGDTAAAERIWRAVADRYAELGDEVRRHVVLGRIGLCCLRTGRVPEGTELIETSSGYLAEHGSAAQRVKAELRRALAYQGTGRAADALAVLDALTDESGFAADVALGRSVALSTLGVDAAERAREQAAAARQGYRADGRFRRYAHASLHHGRLLMAVGDTEGAAEALAEAAAHAGHDPELRATALAMRGGLLARTEQAEDAVDDLVEAVAIFTGRRMRQAPYARFDLAVALAHTGKFLDAAEAAEEGLAVLETVPDDPDAGEASLSFRELLVNVYQQLGEKDNALAHLDVLAGHFTEQGQPDAAGNAHEAAAGILDQLDRDALAAERFAVAAERFGEAGDPFGAVRCQRRRVMSLHWADDTDAALELAARTAEQIERLPDGEPEPVIWERAVLDYNLARILGAVGRLDEARAAARQSADAFRGLDRLEEAGYAEDLLGQLADSQ